MEQSSNAPRGIRVQAPLVDSVLCYCKVDSSLKTVASARKFVPGSKICIQPDSNPKAHKSKNSRCERTRVQLPLLSGLPDDLAIACLIRVPRVEHRKLRLVCKRWYRLLALETSFILLGKVLEWQKSGFMSSKETVMEGFLGMLLIPPTNYGSHFPLSLGNILKHWVLDVPFLMVAAFTYLEEKIHSRDQCVGSFSTAPARTNKWHRAPDMLRRHHFFGSCVINNCLYVAGGECEGIQRTLRSAEVYDPNKNRWSFISDMRMAMVPFIGVVYNGMWFLKGLGSHCEVMSDAYAPETNAWTSISSGMVSGWQNPSISLNGKLYALDCRDGRKVRFYDTTTDL